ncbi:MAG: S41 family peptidase [Chthoniobacterales bacterium]|nr:S41 family peptidase [Chthoniobacterales bacterium]
MKRLSLRTLPSFFAAGILLVTPAGIVRAAEPQPTPTPTPDGNGYGEIATFAKAIELIRQDYVDGDKVSYHDLIYAAMKGMLSSLDPHSQFMDPDDFKDMQDDTRSRFNGLGVEVAMREGVLTVVTPIEDTPAAKAGVLADDEILKINGTSTEKLSLQDAVDVLRGEPGHNITLTILRPSSKEIKDYLLERKEIKVRSVKGARLLSPELTGPYKVAYVRLVQFNEPTAEEFGKALDDLQKQGMQALVLDLRNNPGGLLNSAVDVLGQFLPANTKVVSTQGRAYSQQHEYSTPVGIKERPHFPVAVLVNGGSASGSEIVAGALKDLHRAVVVGETTFGKGSVQNVMQLPDGSALRFTTAKYFTPSKQVIQGNGVVPNIRVPLTLDQERAVASLRNDDKITPDAATALIKAKDAQLTRAIDALKGVMIYAQQTSPAVDAVKK